MKIGELAAQAGCTVETVRYYEREGLLPVAVRDGANYRRYDRGHLERLSFIRRCRALDMAHDEIRALLLARLDPERTCDSVNALVEVHLAHVRARISELGALEAQLSELRGQCRGAQPTRDCGILRELDLPPGPDLEPAPRSPASHVARHACGSEGRLHP
ncbi:Cd(II)/Pb(II)-responsive transcriptional regulator [Geothrix sp. 21YS21S-4]|uniref:Cd(II)/Pb(II)-responsive transcriptional regulator n=1 Tax=Geothrix sp. 21YS21S-4 TaxID=3068889 RepID=UPI0027B95FED|nr:Cd(II)/Pb(II)-responsive transcriptional regulator [Geothrix sp. 21YS21S-4]